MVSWNSRILDYSPLQLLTLSLWTFFGPLGFHFTFQALVRLCYKPSVLLPIPIFILTC